MNTDTVTRRVYLGALGVQRCELEFEWDNGQPACYEDPGWSPSVWLLSLTFGGKTYDAADLDQDEVRAIEAELDELMKERAVA